MRFLSKPVVIASVIVAVLLVGGAGAYLFFNSGEAPSKNASTGALGDYLERLAEERGLNTQTEETATPQGMRVIGVNVASGQIGMRVEEGACDQRDLQIFTTFDATQHQGFLRRLPGKRISINPEAVSSSNPQQMRISEISQISVVGNEIEQAIEASSDNPDSIVDYELIRQCSECFRGKVFSVELPVYSAHVSQMGVLQLSARTECGRQNIEIEAQSSARFTSEPFTDVKNQYLILRSALVESPTSFLVIDPSDVELGEPFSSDSESVPQ